MIVVIIINLNAKVYLKRVRKLHVILQQIFNEFEIRKMIKLVFFLDVKVVFVLHLK